MVSWRHKEFHMVIQMLHLNLLPISTPEPSAATELVTRLPSRRGATRQHDGGEMRRKGKREMAKFVHIYRRQRYVNIQASLVSVVHLKVVLRALIWVLAWGTHTEMLR